MGWKPKQVRYANQAAREAGFYDGKDTTRRDFFLRQLDGRAWDDKDERFSTRSSQLTNSDFEWFMAQCEAACDDDCVGGKPPFYWHNAYREGDWKRRRYLVEHLGNQLAAQTSAGYVEGVIRKAIGEWSGDLDNCEAPQLERILNAFNREGMTPAPGKDSPADATMA